MSVGTASGRVVRCRLLVQELVGPALQDAPIQVRITRPANAKRIPETVFGSFLEPIGHSTYGGLWVGLLIGTILIVGALTYFPALALGPIVDQLMLNAGPA